VTGRESDIDPALLRIAQSVTGTSEEHAFLRRALSSDHAAWTGVYGVSEDLSGVGVERNVFRYHPCELTLRAGGFVPVAEVIRVLLAGIRAGATIHLSIANPLPVEVLAHLRQAPQHLGSLGTYEVEPERNFVLRVASALPERVRLLGSRADALAVAFDGAPEVAIYGDEVTESGRVEMLPFVKEQAVSLTAHRFGAPDPRMSELRI
jgi:RHH-type proline utilization regulon transcriptional repressor/proline dehydrogenase/delta 1-pyrroline-5-carboxylate dehydrogenase